MAMRADLAAALVWEHWRYGLTMAELPDANRPRTIDEGYAVQEALVPLAGDVIGWKIAATSPAGQAHIGVTHPLPGRIFRRFVYSSGSTVPGFGLHMAVAEAEFAFRFGTGVDAGVATALQPDDVLDLVDVMVLAVELPESRFTDFSVVGPAQLLADDACAGRFVLGPEIRDWRRLDLAGTPTRIAVDGVATAQGRGATVLGDPRNALTWLVRDLGARGIGLGQGDIVTTGTTTVPADIRRGSAIRAEFGGLGAVELRIATDDKGFEAVSRRDLDGV